MAISCCGLNNINKIIVGWSFPASGRYSVFRNTHAQCTCQKFLLGLLSNILYNICTKQELKIKKNKRLN